MVLAAVTSTRRASPLAKTHWATVPVMATPTVVFTVNTSASMEVAAVMAVGLACQGEPENAEPEIILL